ncbi:hypothetical protein [Tenacibaculum agarivorans]|uniref:hypothetical protein n=1 Tax=Tenacibaculum agarivorans TaxID=1908389 RepID=UPI00094B8A13|nr:hypothetical protein [Tenacibaculum agarivorans]
MKKTLLSLLLLCGAMSVSFGQEKEKRKEVSINFSSLNSFGFTYKTGTSTNLWRFSTLALNLGNSKTETNGATQGDNENFNIGAQVSVGKEFRKGITKNLEFRYGFDVAFAYSKSKITNDDGITFSESKRTYYTPSLAGVIGVNYVFNDNLAFGVELLPRFSYTTGNSTNTRDTDVVNGDISIYNFGLGNGGAQLSLSYRF